MSKEKLEQAKNKWEEKLAYYEYELSITANAETKFELRERIKQCEEGISRINARLESIVKDDELKNSSFNFKSTEHEDNLLGEIKLLSNKKIDYTQLRNLLAAGKWQKADRETATIILKLASKEKPGWLRIEDISKLPCQDLLAIDRFWAKYSSGHFGFGVQKQMWSEANGNIVTFGHRIGWCVNNNWRSHYSDYIFSLNAPFGHLPSLKWLSGWRLQEDIWEQEYGFMGRLMKPVFTPGHIVSYLFFNDTQWESLSKENYRAESISALMSRLEYCNSLLESNKKQSYFVWVFFLLFSSCLVSLFLIQA